MKINLKSLFTTVIVTLSLLVLSFFWINKCTAADSHSQVEETKILLSVRWWILNIWISWGLLTLHGTWWSIVTWQFSDNAFWVNDWNWSTKYWTTVSATDLKYASGDEVRIIPAENIMIKKWDGPHTMTWLDNPWIRLNDELSGYQSLGWPVKYFIYDNPNGILWLYWDTPEILIDIPQEASIGCHTSFPCVYKWTITFTLYEDDSL